MNAFLRVMSVEDLELVLQWRNHPDVRRFMYTQHEIGLDEHRKWFEASLENELRHNLIFQIGQDKLGFVNVSEGVSGHLADWGFYLSPGAKKGMGRLLGSLALDYSFDRLDLHKVCGQALGFNERSIHFHLALGFTQEGTLRDQHFDGEKYHDIVNFGLLKCEWQALKREARL